MTTTPPQPECHTYTEDDLVKVIRACKTPGDLSRLMQGSPKSIAIILDVLAKLHPDMLMERAILMTNQIYGNERRYPTMTDTWPEGEIMTGTEATKRHDEMIQKLAGIAHRDPVGFIFAANTLLKRQWLINKAARQYDAKLLEVGGEVETVIDVQMLPAIHGRAGDNYGARLAASKKLPGDDCRCPECGARAGNTTGWKDEHGKWSLCEKCAPPDPKAGTPDGLVE